MVEYINYKGEKLPIRIAWSTMKKLASTDDKIDVLELMLWYGLISGHVAETKELKIEQKEVEFILDESIVEFKEIVKKATKKLDDEKSPKDDKKK